MVKFNVRNIRLITKYSYFNYRENADAKFKFVFTAKPAFLPNATPLFVGWSKHKSKAPWAAHGWIAQFEVYFCLCNKTSLFELKLKLKLNWIENFIYPRNPFTTKWYSKEPCLAKLFVWKYVTCTFIHIKIKSFSCETFCTSTRSEEEANDNSEVEVKSACMHVPSAPPGQHLFQFL